MEYDLNELLHFSNDFPAPSEIEQEIPILNESEVVLTPTDENEVSVSTENSEVPQKKKKIVKKKSALQKKCKKLKLKIKSNLKKVKQSVKKGKKTPVKKSSVGMTVSPRPHLVLQNIHFLNESGTKYISIGYDSDNSFRLSIIISTNQSYVYFTVADWLAFMLNVMEISNYLKQRIVSDDDSKFHTSCNIKVSKENINERNFIYIENMPQTRVNNGILLDFKEFDRCMLLESFIQQSLKQMQVNPSMIEDYYNWYVYHCHTRQKKILDENDYFAPFGNPSTFDSFRLFQEIPIYCEEKLNLDLSYTLESTE